MRNSNSKEGGQLRPAPLFPGRLDLFQPVGDAAIVVKDNYAVSPTMDAAVSGPPHLRKRVQDGLNQEKRRNGNGGFQKIHGVTGQEYNSPNGRQQHSKPGSRI